jgi:hypothetical protein
VKSIRLFKLGELGGPWHLELRAFDQNACVVGLSWQRYMDRLDIGIHPLPFVDLNVTLRGLPPDPERPSSVRHLFECGGRKGPRYLSLCWMPWSHLYVGVTWYRDRERFELTLSPVPRLTFFYTRVDHR